jgi:hypothetical protein
MPVDFIVNSQNITTPGNSYTQGVNYAGTFAAQMSQAAPQAVATGTAIILIPAQTSVVRISAAAATTGASLPQGTVQGQMLMIIITTAAANTVTFAAAGTSFVAGGATVSLAGLASHWFIWDSVGLLWYQVGPATN